MIQTKAVIYARYSSDNQREESIDAQLRVCRKHCAEKGYIIIHEYIDEAYTATNDNRPAYQAMLRDSSRREFQVAVFHKVNRNARNEYDYYVNKAKLMKNGVRIEYAGQAFDTSTAEGQLMENQLVGMAAYFSRNLAREVKKGQNENALKCLHNGGTPPLGYNVCPSTRKYIVDDFEANEVRFLFDAYARGTKYPDIIAECERRGYKTKRGNHFGYNSLHDILRNKKYIGVYVYGKTRGSKNAPRNSHKYSKDAIEIEGGLPSIIDMATWTAVQDRLDGKTHKKQSLHAKRVYLLSDLIICGECGCRMSTNSYRKKLKNGDKNEHVYYRCRNCRNIHIERDAVERYVINAVKKNITGKRRINSIVSAINKALEHNNTSEMAELRSIEKELASISKANDNLMSAIESGIMSDTIKERLQQNEERANALKTREAEIYAEHRQHITTEDVKLVLLAWQNVKDADGLRAMLKTFVQSVIVYTDRIELNLCIAMNGISYTAKELMSGEEKAKIVAHKKAHKH